MGAGGRNDDKSKRQEDSHLHRVPTEKPPFTFSQIKKAIPPHCFQRSLLRSFSYLVYDLFLSSLFYYIANTYIHLLPYPLPYIAWPIYWVVQGSVLTGVWVIAHECGHHAFSDYQWVDDTIGFILHSALLAPYFSWKYSHRRHHANTGSMENDEVYVPILKSSTPWHWQYTNNPPGRVLSLAITLVFGWPLYLAFNAAGRNYGRYANHFNPYSPIYSDRERLQILLSDIAMFAVTYLLYMAAASKGLVWVMCTYGGPLLFVNGFVVIITFLHHTHLALPHYDSSEWDWLKGALATVDRDFGVLSKVFHNISDTHVTHHLFSSMPHYHAMEATKAIKPILGDYYRFDATPIYKALWREAKECLYVEPDEDGGSKGVFWYRNKL